MDEFKECGIHPLNKCVFTFSDFFSSAITARPYSETEDVTGSSNRESIIEGTVTHQIRPSTSNDGASPATEASRPKKIKTQHYEQGTPPKKVTTKKPFI